MAADAKTRGVAKGGRGKRARDWASLNGIGRNRFDALMKVARAALIRDGYAQLRMRKIASEAGISVGHLQHFLPTKDSLIESLWEYALAEYYAEYDRLLRDLPADPRKRFLALINYWLRDVASSSTKAFFLELWAAARHHLGAQATMNRVQTHHNQRLARFIGDLNPHLSRPQLDIRALQVAAMVDGLIVHLEEAPPSQLPNALIDEITETIMEIATAPPKLPIGSDDGPRARVGGLRKQASQPKAPTQAAKSRPARRSSPARR
jgi:AcrR family transcriptional regulator